jgi:hypothetical protein
MSRTRFGFVRLFVVLGKALLIAAALALFAAYFASHVREAGGTVVRAVFEWETPVPLVDRWRATLPGLATTVWNMWLHVRVIAGIP